MQSLKDVGLRKIVTYDLCVIINLGSICYLHGAKKGDMAHVRGTWSAERTAL